MGCERQGARAAEENEGGWSIPEAAGANGCLLGCAGPTRGSFTQGSNPREGQGRKRMGPGRRSRELSLLQTLEGQGSDWEGPQVEVHALPDLRPHGIPRRRFNQAGGRQPLAGGNALKSNRSPVGSRDMCSTVHGSYQLSIDPPTLPCDFQPPSAVPATRSYGGLVRYNLTLLCPLGIWSRLVPMPSPYSY